MGALLAFPSASSLDTSSFVDELSVSAASVSETVILVREGVSFISPAQACSNAESEAPNFEFDDIRQSAESEWRELLSRINVTASSDVDADTKTLLYSSLYRTHVSPADCKCHHASRRPTAYVADIEDFRHWRESQLELNGAVLRLLVL